MAAPVDPAGSDAPSEGDGDGRMAVPKTEYASGEGDGARPDPAREKAKESRAVPFASCHVYVCPFNSTSVNYFMKYRSSGVYECAPSTMSYLEIKNNKKKVLGAGHLY